MVIGFDRNAWNNANPSERAAWCRLRASEARRRAQQACGDPSTEYARLTNEWDALANDIAVTESVEKPIPRSA